MNNNDIEIPVSALHASLREIGDMCGVEVAISLVHHLGGRRIRVPMEPKEDHLLSAIGEVSFEKLCDEFPYSYIDVPISYLCREGRNSVAVKLLQGGRPGCRAA